MQIHTPAGAGMALIAVIIAFLLAPFIVSFIPSPSKG
jgi:hypothetical protein